VSPTTSVAASLFHPFAYRILLETIHELATSEPFYTAQSGQATTLPAKSFINFPGNSVTSQNLVQTSECDIYVWRPLSNRTVIFLMLDVLLVHHTVRDTCGLLTLPVTIPRNEREIHHPASLRVSFLRARSRVQGPVPNNIP
jgi:hypothetical protein